jgi:hypothetical protein
VVAQRQIVQLPNANCVLEITENALQNVHAMLPHVKTAEVNQSKQEK